ncbi:WD repeat-containing protein 6, partial [Kappamyces sp. JEL0680]
ITSALVASAPPTSAFAETRIMDISGIGIGSDYLLAAAMSDGKVNLWRFCESSRTSMPHFALLESNSFHKRCVQKAQLLQDIDSSLLLFTAATDGTVVLWRIENDRLVYQHQWTCHQSGVKALHAIIDARSVYLCTGGDDNSVSYLRIPLDDPSHSLLLSSPSAHGSSVTGCYLASPLHLFTVSIDQRINEYRVEHEQLQWVASTFFDIADASDISCLERQGRLLMAVVGHGLQYTIAGFWKLLELLQVAHSRLPPAQQEQLHHVYYHLDVVLGLFTLLTFLFVLGKRKRKASWTDVFLTCFWAAISLLMLLFALYQNIIGQFSVWYKKQQQLTDDVDASLFQAKLPLDFKTDISYQDITSYYEDSGAQGRFFYAIYLCVDTILLISTTILQRQLFSITYPEEGDGGPHMMSMAAQYLPLVLAACDLYENVSLLTVSYWWMQMQLNAPSKLNITHSFVSRIAYVSKIKLGLTWTLLGLQSSGLVQYLVEKAFPSKEKQDPQPASPAPVSGGTRAKNALRNRKGGRK